MDMYNTLHQPRFVNRSKHSAQGSSPSEPHVNPTASEPSPPLPHPYNTLSPPAFPTHAAITPDSTDSFVDAVVPVRLAEEWPPVRLPAASRVQRHCGALQQILRD